MNLRLIMPLITLIILISCSGLIADKGPKTMDFKSFQIVTPGNWNEFKLHGIDSYVGGITNGIDSLTFDYGQYSYDFAYETSEKHNFSRDTVNGKSARIIRPKTPGQGMLGIYIESAYNGNHFNLIGYQINDEATVLSIFKTIRFPDSDTTLNSLNFAGNFEKSTAQKEALTVFKRNCASCHNQNEKQMIGPGFGTISKQEFDLWFSDSTFNFIPSTDFLTQYGPDYHRTFMKTLTETELVMLRQLFSDN